MGSARCGSPRPTRRCSLYARRAASARRMNSAIYVCSFHAELLERVTHVDDLVVQRVPRRADVSQLLRGYIRSLERGSAAHRPGCGASTALAVSWCRLAL